MRKEEEEAFAPQPRQGPDEAAPNDDLESSSTDSSGETSDSASDWDVDQESVQSSSNSESQSDDEDGVVQERRYPQRERAARNIPGAIPWSAVPKL